MQIHTPINRSGMPIAPSVGQPELANEIARSPVFSAIANEVGHERDVQAMKWNYTYTLEGEITGQQTLPFDITIEQGTDFKCLYLTGSFFSYDSENDTDFPVPNSAGITSWAGRGLSVKLTDSRSARELTSGYVPVELMNTPGYGLNFQMPYPFRYFFYRNSKIKFDIRNRDNSDRVHQFAFALNGYKILTAE